MKEWQPAETPVTWGDGTPNVTKWKKEMRVIDGARVYRETTVTPGEDGPVTETTYYGDDTPEFLHLDSLLMYLRDAGKIVLR